MDRDNFHVIEYVGDPVRDFICKRATEWYKEVNNIPKEVSGIGTYRARGSLYGTHEPCKGCEFRFVCITGGLDDALSDGEDYYIVDEFGKQTRIRVRKNGEAW